MRSQRREEGNYLQRGRIRLVSDTKFVNIPLCPRRGFDNSRLGMGLGQGTFLPAKRKAAENRFPAAVKYHFLLTELPGRT